MSVVDSNFTGSIPDVYDDYLVPLIFEPYAADLARRTESLKPGSILETAAGSGVVTRAIASVLPDHARLTVTDLNPPMLERARRQQGADQRIEWQPADALALPFDSATFDLVLCQFGVMFFPDRVKGYTEALRVLKPNGRFIFNIWDRIEANEFADCVTAAAAEIFPDNPPMFLARTPHGHGNADTIERELRAAGFSSVDIEVIETLSRAPNPRHPAIAYVQGTPLRNEIEARDAAKLDTVTDRAELRIRERWGHGPVEAKIRGFVVTAA